MELTSSLGYLLNVSARLMKQDLDNQLKKYQITTSQWYVMKVLFDCGELTQVEITKKINSDQATSGAIIERMIKNDLLQKRRHEVDRRVYIVSLTEYGQSIVKELEALAQSTNQRALNGIDEDEAKRLYEVLHQIVNNLKEG